MKKFVQKYMTCYKCGKAHRKFTIDSTGKFYTEAKEIDSNTYVCTHCGNQLAHMFLDYFDFEGEDIVNWDTTKMTDFSFYCNV